jgi:S-methylmethionine-dependent homocysteine/selenocysteine methylase
MNFEKLFCESEIILTEGAIVERLKNESGLTMDRFINHGGYIYKNSEILKRVYTEYLDIAQNFNLPVMLMTPTRKVNFESLEKSEFRDKNLIIDSCRFLDELKGEFNGFKEKIAIGGLLGCRGDAYNATEALIKEEAYKFHSVQVKMFMEGKPDFLFAGIMPAITEAVGMAQAMSESGTAYIISFMVRKNGELLDGTPISEAIRIIDSETDPKPLCYMANCIHPANLRMALSQEINFKSPYIRRFCGIQANASPLSPEELNNCGILQQSNFDEMVDEMEILHKEHGLKILGGCCGTDGVFIQKLAEKLKK